MDPAGLVIIVGIIVTYKLVSRHIDVRRMEAQARLRETEEEDSSHVYEELVRIREMLADLTIEDHAHGPRHRPLCAILRAACVLGRGRSSLRTTPVGGRGNRTGDDMWDPGVIGVFVPIIAMVLGYRLISRNIEAKKLEAQARLRDDADSPIAQLQEDVLAIKEMLADVVLEGHVGSREALPPHADDEHDDYQA